jgi:hypothetical protein
MMMHGLTNPKFKELTSVSGIIFPESQIPSYDVLCMKTCWLNIIEILKYARYTLYQDHCSKLPNMMSLLDPLDVTIAEHATAAGGPEVTNALPLNPFS